VTITSVDLVLKQSILCVSFFLSQNDIWLLLLYYLLILLLKSGPGSSVGLATDYGLEGPGSNPGGDEILRLSRPALGPTQPPVQWVPGLSQG